MTTAFKKHPLSGAACASWSEASWPSAYACAAWLRPPISQALAGGTLQRLVSTLSVVNAKRGAGVVAEIELGEVAMKVDLRHVMIDAVDAALQN